MRNNILFGVAMVLASSGCGIRDSERQLRTYVRLQIAGDRIARFDREHRRLPDWPELERLLGNESRDAWGRSFVYDIVDEDGEKHYVLLSMGRDGKPDVSAPSEWLGRVAGNVTRQYDRDLVVVDGRFIQGTGK